MRIQNELYKSGRMFSILCSQRNVRNVFVDFLAIWIIKVYVQYFLQKCYVRIRIHALYIKAAVLSNTSQIEKNVIYLS